MPVLFVVFFLCMAAAGPVLFMGVVGIVLPARFFFIVWQKE